MFQIKCYVHGIRIAKYTFKNLIFVLKLGFTEQIKQILAYL